VAPTHWHGQLDGSYRSGGELPRLRLRDVGALVGPHMPDGGDLRLSVGSALFGFGVDDPAACCGRLEPLGLGSACLTAPLVLAGRSLV
jgi:hypothetical protein